MPDNDANTGAIKINKVKAIVQTRGKPLLFIAGNYGHNTQTCQHPPLKQVNKQGNPATRRVKDDYRPRRLPMSGESPQEIILKHRLSKQFVSHYSDGVILNGPGPSGMWTMIFYVESFGIEFEKLKKEDDQYKIKLEESSQGYFREDQARIAMTETGLRNLYTILKARFDPQQAQSR